MATTQVDSTAALSAALKSAQGGDTILLAPGTYSGALISGLSIPGGVTITSADPAHEAVLTNFNIVGSAGLTFSNLEFYAQAPAGYAFQVNKSSDIHFDHISLHGSLDGDASNDANGLQVMGSTNVTITNSEFQQLGRAIGVSTTDGATVSGNYVHDIRSDGMDLAQVGNIKVLNNVLKDFTPLSGDHPDAIQLWTTGTTAASHDLQFSGNLILKGDGSTVQGIFIGDETGSLPLQRVTISDNTIVSTGYNAIRVHGAVGLTVTNNNLITNVGDYKTYMLIEKADGVTSTGNHAIGIGFSLVTNLVESGDITTGTVTDGGLSAIKSWLSTHPDADFALANFINSATTITGDTGDNLLAGGTGADLIMAGAGNDTVTDAGGDNYLRGEDGNDSVVGGSGFDDINGNAGNDTASGGGGDDWVVGGKDQDLLSGQDGSDIVYGNLGNDTCDGGAGNDLVRGGQQDDVLTGGDGNDWLSGDRGNDTITGGAGADIFHSFGDAGIDRITDFHQADGDRVQLDPGTQYTVAQVGADTVISMTGGGQMVLVGVQLSSLTQGWLFES